MIWLHVGGLALANDGGSGLEASTSAEVTCEGEAVINNRKNKLIAAYELEVKGGWSGNTPPLPHAGGRSQKMCKLQYIDLESIFFQ